MGRNNFILFYFILVFQRGKRREEEETGKVPYQTLPGEREKKLGVFFDFCPLFLDINTIYRLIWVKFEKYGGTSGAQKKFTCHLFLLLK